MRVSRTLARLFPTPRYLAPSGAGVDITDASIKWLRLVKTPHGARVASFGSQSIPQGTVAGGAVKDGSALANVLTDVRRHCATRYAHASLPEEGAYVFGLHVPANTDYRGVQNLVEFELEGRVPLPVADTVYDFDTIFTHRDGSAEISVTAFAKELAEGYAQAFSRAGIELLSLELEARSIARAVTRRSREEPVTLLADSGNDRTGIAILRRGIPIFTTTVDVGGRKMSEAVMQALSVSEADAEVFKNEHGLVKGDDKTEPARRELEKVVATLADEIVRHYHFWDTRRNEHGEKVTPVGRVWLVGGCANLKGLTDYIAGKVHAPTERPNVWLNVASFDDYVPPIERRASLQYPTAIGLALRSIDV